MSNSSSFHIGIMTKANLYVSKDAFNDFLFIKISQNACDTQNHTFTKIDDY